MSLTEKIKQIFDSEINYREGLFKIPTKEDRPKNRRMITILKQIKKDVLALLDGYMPIPVGKWQQIVELTANYPKLLPKEEGMLQVSRAWGYYQRTKKHFEVLEAKVAEIGGELNE